MGLDSDKVSTYLTMDAKCKEAPDCITQTPPMAKCVPVSSTPTMGYCQGETISYSVCAADDDIAQMLAAGTTQVCWRFLLFAPGPRALSSRRFAFRVSNTVHRPACNPGRAGGALGPKILTAVGWGLQYANMVDEGTALAACEKATKGACMDWLGAEVFHWKGVGWVLQVLQGASRAGRYGWSRLFFFVHMVLAPFCSLLGSNLRVWHLFF